MASSTAARFSTGRAPGKPRQTGKTLLFGCAPKLVGQAQKILVAVASWTCTSRPITGSYLAIRPGPARSTNADDMLLYYIVRRPILAAGRSPGAHRTLTAQHGGGPVREGARAPRTLSSARERLSSKRTAHVESVQVMVEPPRPPRRGGRRGIPARATDLPLHPRHAVRSYRQRVGRSTGLDLDGCLVRGGILRRVAGTRNICLRQGSLEQGPICFQSYLHGGRGFIED